MNTESRPLIIVMTPVRNEAWVLRAFLETTSLWADYIVVADQLSDDGSRELLRNYPKVVLVDNATSEFNEPERQSILIAKAREIAGGRDALLWGLDADEILAANAFETKDWDNILHSKPGDVFWFKWVELCPDQRAYYLSPQLCNPCLFHDDGMEPHGNFVRNMHSMRIPYPMAQHHKKRYIVQDFRILHLAYLNPYRVASKRRFYQFVDWELNHRSPVKLIRSYTQFRDSHKVMPLPDSFLFSDKYHFNLLDMVDREKSQCYMDDYIVERIPKHGTQKIRSLDIWDEVMLKKFHLKDPRRNIDKLVHWYLRVTTSKRDSFPVRCMDKILKWVYAR